MTLRHRETLENTAKLSKHEVTREECDSLIHRLESLKTKLKHTKSSQRIASSEIMRQPRPPQSKRFWGALSMSLAPTNFHFCSRIVYPAAMIAQISMNFSNNQLDIVIFTMRWAYCPSNPGWLTASIELKDPKPTPPGNGEPEERPRRHEHTIAGHGKKPWPPP